MEINFLKVSQEETASKAIRRLTECDEVEVGSRFGISLDRNSTHNPDQPIPIELSSRSINRYVATSHKSLNRLSGKAQGSSTLPDTTFDVTIFEISGFRITICCLYLPSEVPFDTGMNE